FGHRSTASSNASPVGLRVIPAMVCVDHLIARCSNQAEVDPSGNGLIRCVVGYHSGPEDLLDLDRYRGKIPPRTPASSYSQGTPTTSAGNVSLIGESLRH